MAEYFENKEIKESVLLVGISTGAQDDGEASLNELAQLVKTAGAESVGFMFQNR